MASLKVPAKVPLPSEDAEQLHKAFQAGWGTDEAKIISILSHRNAAQRALIRKVYLEAYGEDLIVALRKEISGDFESCVTLWTIEPSERDALLAHEAVAKKVNSSYWIVMEIACTRSSDDLFKVRQAYHARYKKSLEEDVMDQAKGEFRKLLAPLLTAFRYEEGNEVDLSLAKSEAKILHDKIAAKAYGDDEIIRILSTRSKPQLNATLNQYNDAFGSSITKHLKDDPKDEYLKLLRAAIKCLTYPEKYFEKVLRLSMKGFGTDECSLTRVVVTRAEVDMQRIKEEYHRRNSVTLESAISGDTSGDYAAMLLALVGHGDA
ncbi:unnamed protein product [Linum trigynum]|uniref:Annexin n=1 Tax=Linum trigynum TaxID=586398 RepID=A0AAV2DTH4_9ROSI